MRPRCPDIFAELTAIGIKDRYHVGDSVSNRNINKELSFLKLAANTSVFFLGKGGAAAVYRIVPKNGTPYLIKKYHDDFRMGDNEEAKAMASDNQLMERLREAKVEDPDGTIEIAVASKQYLESHATQYEDVRGFSLRVAAKALPGGKNEKRKILANEFNRRLSNLIKTLRGTGTIRNARKQAIQEEEGFDWYHVEWAWNEPGAEADFGGVDNIIYDAITSRFVLIDPE
jgi:hypothetical protein